MLLSMIVGGISALLCVAAFIVCCLVWHSARPTDMQLKRRDWSRPGALDDAWEEYEERERK